MQAWRTVLQLQQAETLAAMGELSQACATLKDSVFSSGRDLQPGANTAQVWAPPTLARVNVNLSDTSGLVPKGGVDVDVAGRFFLLTGSTCRSN